MNVQELSDQHITMRLTFLGDSKITLKKELDLIEDEVKSLNNELLRRKMNRGVE